MLSKVILYTFCILFHLSLFSSEYYVPGENDRIIFIGDSITAQGQLHSRGWGFYVREALTADGYKDKSNVVLLGGSGQSIGSWTAVEKRSREKEVFLDSKKLNIGEELDKGAEVLVIMLGMNDVLGPYLKGDQDSVDDWGKRYLTFIDNLQKRLKAKQVCMATVTMCTEDLDSYKNSLVAKLNKKIYQLAKGKGYKVMTTSERYIEAFKTGRKYRHNYHITGDYVHPNSDGHIAIATGMLEGLGKSGAVKYIKEKYYNQIGPKLSAGKVGVSYEVKNRTSSANQSINSYDVHYYITNTDNQALVNLELPEGWSAEQTSMKGNEGVFNVKGVPAKLENKLKITAVIDSETHEKEIKISAPWLIKWGIKQPHWRQNKLPENPDVYGTEIDKSIESGKSLTTDKWTLYQPSLNYTGGENPGSIDFASVTVCKPFDCGYGVRWIKSSKDREVNLKLSSRIFAGNIYLTVWLNKDAVYKGEITGKPGKKDEVRVSLKKGWNRLVFKSNRISWQWQQAIELLPIKGDSLDDLEYSILEK